MKLAALSLYPVKSCQAWPVSEANVLRDGLVYDRRWVVVTPKGKFLTGRTHPKLALLSATMSGSTLTLCAPSMSPLLLDSEQLAESYQHIQIWNSELQAQRSPAAADRWMSEYLGEEVHLCFQGAKTHRPIAQLEHTVSFADGFPLLLASTSSLAELNRRSPEPVGMERFRTNLVIDGAPAFAEDDWIEVRIGEVRFAIVKPCSRCVFTTLDATSQQYDEGGEPLTTLKTFRQDDKGEVFFGTNLIPLNEGVLRVGDTLEVLTSSPARRYPERPRPVGAVLEKAADKAVSITFAGQGEFTGNTQQTLLEQVERAGFELPASCRAGICGTCKAKLTRGQVVSRSVAPLSAKEQAEGMVLTCCSYPLDDVELSVQS